MKRFFNAVLLLMALGFAGNASAQGKLTEEQKKELTARLERYRTELNLTDQQQEKVKAINTAYFEKLEDLKESGGSRMSKLKTFRKASNEHDKQIKDVLDEKQYETYKKMQKELKSELKNKRNQ